MKVKRLLGHRLSKRVAMNAKPEPKRDDTFFMQLALEEATKAYELGESPVGAVVVFEGQPIAAAHNLRETYKDPTAHAEMLAIRDAAITRGGWRLFGCTMYVTLEPCAMCAGALLLARFDRLVYGVRDPKSGAAGSIYNLVQEPLFNHRLEVSEGVLAEQCGAILSEFFRQLRQRHIDD